MSTHIDAEKYIFYNIHEVMIMAMKPDTKTLTLRVSKELHKAIMDAAKIEDRSVNNFIAYAVKTYIEIKHDNVKK